MSENEVNAPVSTDLANLDMTSIGGEGATMEVRHPGTGDVLRHAPESGEEIGRPFTITLRSMDSDEVQKVARQQADRRAAQQARTRVPVSSTVLERDMIDLLMVATIKWDLVIDGRVPPSDKAAFKSSYTKYRWLAEQATDFIGVRANFLKS